MSADRKESEHTLQLGDCVHYKGQGFGKIVKVGRFFVEVLFTSGRRLQTCVGRPGKHDAEIANELRAVIDALPSKSVARNLASGVVIDHNAYGLGRVISCTGNTVEIRFPKLNSTRRFLLADNIGLIVDLFGRSMGQCRTEINEPSGRKPLMKIVSRNLGLQARSTGGSTSESDPSQRNTSSPSSRVREVRAAATVETNLPASARHIGSTETDGRTGRLSVRLPREAPADSSSIPTRPNRAAATIKTERTQLAAARRAATGSEGNSSQKGIRKRLLKCCICRKKQRMPRDSVCANCRKELKQSFRDPSRGSGVGPRRGIKSSLNLGVLMRRRGGIRDVQAGLPSLGKRR